MRINSSGGTQEAALDDSDAGEGLAVFFSQNGQSTARYRFRVKAIVDGGVYDIGEFYSSPPILAAGTPAGRLSRMIGGAICPGATGWRVAVSCENGVEDDTADIVLSSSRCYGSLGAYRVNERYQMAAGGVGGSYTVLPGQTITGIAAVAVGAGTIEVGAGEDLISIPDGISANLAPESPILPGTVITFVNVEWVIEYKESA